MNMWNRKLKEKVKSLEERIDVLENPYKYNVGQNIKGFIAYSGNNFYKKGLVVIDRKHRKGALTGEIYKEYLVTCIKTNDKHWLSEERIITKKPKKNANTKA